ncbi:MAG: ABC transporter substrate-binding protein, partial [Chloroflexi bacterium]|nr:ABC transporter substrate-binding protein [Chloroflexota bacterium]
SSVEQGIRGARKLITTNGVIVIGGPISDVLLAILDFAQQNKVVVWSPAAGTTKLDQMTGSYHFRTVPSDSFDGKVAAHVLWEKGFKNIGMLFENDEGRLSISKVVKAEFEKLGGKVVVSEPFNPKQTTYSAELKGVYDNKPDAVWIGAGQESSPVLLKDWSQRGYGGQLMVASDIAVPQIFDLVGKQIMEGILTEMPSADENSAQYQRFAKKFRELYNAEPGGGFQSNSYDGMILTALAIQAAGEATGEAVANNLAKVANPPGTAVTTFADGVAELKKGNEINYEGASGPLDFDQYNNVSGSYASMIAKGGSWVQDKFYPAGALG